MRRPRAPVSESRARESEPRQAWRAAGELAGRGGALFRGVFPALVFLGLADAEKLAGVAFRDSAGAMASHKFKVTRLERRLGRYELMSWINSFLRIDYAKVEEFSWAAFFSARNDYPLQILVTECWTSFLSKNLQ